VVWDSGPVPRERKPEIPDQVLARAERLDEVQEAHVKLDAAEAQLEEAREQFREALRAAYESGATYQEIGDLLGLSRQRIAQLIAG
jgi:DNA-directed RNA polymerase specialized sigma24 family protein